MNKRDSTPPGKRAERLVIHRPKAHQPAMQKGVKPFHKPGRAPVGQNRRSLAGTVVIGAHLLALAAVLWPYAMSRPAEKKPTLSLQMVSLEPKPPAPPDPTELEAGAATDVVVPPTPQVALPMVTIARTPASDTSDLLSESQLAGATRAGDGGSGGGACDTARAVQQVLRRDPRVRAAVAEADRLGKASMLWNGDWVRSGGQEGKGLAVVRQAILWEVGFSPAACRNEPMHGMIVVSLADGRTRFAIGTGDWRWSDLLGLRGVSRQGG